MFEDHWYEHSTSQDLPPQATLNLRRSDSIKRQSLESPRSSGERVREREKPKPPSRKIPEIPEPSIPRRAQSYSNFTELQRSSEEDGGFINIQAIHVVPGSSSILRRPKSQNDMKTTYQQQIPGAGKVGTVGLQVLGNELDLLGWYEDFEDQLQDSGNDEYKLFLSTIESHLWTCERLLEMTDSTLAILLSLKTSFIAVQHQTSTFQTQCENLVAEEQRLESLSAQTGRALAPFMELEGIVTRLNRPGVEFVKTRSFSDMLGTLDWCLEDLAKYSHFKDTPTYLPRFRRCMTIALTLIRDFFMSSLRETSADVSKRMVAKNLTETTQSALLYARFRVNAPELRDLVAEIEKRCLGHEEYISLLNDCYKAFFSSRLPLVAPLMAKKMADVASSSSSVQDLVSFARSSISEAKSICTDEFELFYAYFSTGERDVYAFLESVCKPLYDRLRPKILTETDILKLCELCTLLQSRYTRDPDESEYDPIDKSQFDFGRLIQGIFQDTQKKLVASAQVVLKTSIMQYVPTFEDLDYPPKVPAKEDSKSNMPVPTEVNDGQGISGGFDTDTVFQGWYPTLRKAIWLLSRIYRLVNPTVFGDIAHKIVHSCTLSLIKASQEIAKRKTPVDGYLFLIKHLLILKEQIVAFDIEYLPPEQGEAELQETLSGTFWDVYMKGGLFTRDGILKLVSVGAGWTGGPVENMIDAKVELDATLRTAITSFTTSYASKILSPILATTQPTNQPEVPNVPAPNLIHPHWQPQVPQRVSSPLSFRSMSPNPMASPHLARSPTPLPQPPVLVFALSTELTGKSRDQIAKEIQGNMDKEFSGIRDILQEYAIGDWRTRETLVGAVQELVMDKQDIFLAQFPQDGTAETATATGLNISGI